jgi:WD40 repeat protein/sterol desaturase/sphingolipid hydroxylase (fatty acid hydroxylase superfamily)
MEWLRVIGGVWLTTLAWSAGLAVGFGILGCLMPCNPGMYWWKNLRAAATDLIYRFVVPLFTRMILRTMLLIGVLTLLFGTKEPQLWPMGTLPVWQQCLAILLIQDVMLYWIHRLFHTRPGWKFHAVHHSPKVLDWMSTSRFHPVNDVLEFVVVDVAVLLMGFPWETIFLLAPFNIIYSAMVHANLNWTFGPLRYIFASPVYHRWHHTTQEQGLDKNFASTFPFLDLIFGTYYMPAGQLPEQFGNGDPDYPEDFWGQLIRPFQSSKSSRTSRPPRWLRLGEAGLKVTVTASVLAAGLTFADELSKKYEASTSKQAEIVEVPVAPHRAAVLSVAMSTDGRLIVSGSEDGSVKAWDTATGMELFSLAGHSRAVRAVALSADGRQIVSGGHDRTVRVWDVHDRRETVALTGHTGGVQSVAIRADGRQILSAGDFTTRSWDPATGQAQTFTGSRSAVLSVAISSDGCRFAEARGESIKVRDARSGRELLSLDGHGDLVESVAFSADDRAIVSGSVDGTVKVWDAATGKELRTLRGHGGAVYSVAIALDGRMIVSGSEDRTIKLWDMMTGLELSTLSGHLDAVTCVAVSADGHWIVSGSRDGTMRIWDTDRDAFHKRLAQRQ